LLGILDSLPEPNTAPNLSDISSYSLVSNLRDAMKDYFLCPDTPSKNSLPTFDGDMSAWLWSCYRISVFRAILFHSAGWLVSALAISLGAPFWFDVLNRFVVLRSTVKPNEKSQTNASKETTGVATT